MARYVKPLSDFNKMFKFYFNNKNEIKEFEDNGEIFGHKPFQDYISNFNDSYGYWITKSVDNGLFGVKTYYYKVHIIKIDE